jgi:exopolysaccharide production protein ExoZ
MVKLRSIQSLRALAACSVVLLHAHLVSGGPRPSEMQLGAAGVDLFFVISGFIMASVLRGRSAGEFMADRCWRIYPLWWAAAIPELIRDGFTPSQLATSITLWPIWGRSYTYPLPELGWTLAFEMLFYAALALALKTRACVPLALFAAFLMLGQFVHTPLIAFLGHPLVLEFLAGFCIARLPRDGRWAPVLIVAGIAGFAVAPVDFYSLYVAEQGHAGMLRVLCWGLPAAALVYGCLCIEKRFSRPLLDVPVLLGDASYSIYLFHLTIMGALPTGLNWIMLALISIAGGVVIHLTLEKRISDLRRALRDWRVERREARV